MIALIGFFQKTSYLNNLNTSIIKKDSGKPKYLLKHSIILAIDLLLPKANPLALLTLISDLQKQANQNYTTNFLDIYAAQFLTKTQ